MLIYLDIRKKKIFRYIVIILINYFQIQYLIAYAKIKKIIDSLIEIKKFRD